MPDYADKLRRARGVRFVTGWSKLCTTIFLAKLMDLVTQKRIRESLLLGLVTLMAVVANLPPSFAHAFGVEPGLIMSVLGLLVVLALFLYVRFFFFLLYALLAVGANLPERWAEGLGIHQGPLLATLVSMVLLSVLNYSAKVLPTGLEKVQRKKNPEATQVLLNAIDRGNLSYIKTVLTMEFDLDAMGDQGMTPLMRAAQRGDMKVVELLLSKGASPSIDGSEGRAVDIALRNSFPAVTERLLRAEEQEQAQQKNSQASRESRMEQETRGDAALVG